MKKRAQDILRRGKNLCGTGGLQENMAALCPQWRYDRFVF